MFRTLLLSTLLIVGSAGVLAGGTYQEPGAFLGDSFSEGTPEAAVIWLTGERKQAIQKLLGHSYTSLRVRYWRQDMRSAWILEEVGKEQPITVGIVVSEGRLERIKVLVFRESRGWEVRHPFFTDQFKNAGLNKERQLDRPIDGISGATLSVRAMKKLAAMALYLDSQLGAMDVTPAP